MSKSYLFLGVYTQHWSPSDFDAPIAICKKLGISGLLVKVYEHTQGEWYAGKFDAIYQRILAAGLECIPFGFHLGNTEGSSVATEAAIGLKFMGEYGAYCMDAESAFDGQDAWGKQLAAAWANHPGKLWISTWANPETHKWLGIIDALKPLVSAWMPQCYSDKLADLAKAQWPHGLPMQPTVGIVGDGDANSPAKHTKLFGETDLSIWEYQEIAGHAATAEAIMHAFGSTVTPVVTPAPQTSSVPTVTPTPAPAIVELANFPFRNQLTDGDPNSGLDCVPTSMADGASWVLGKRIDGAAMKDAVYGRNYIGGTSAKAYVDYLKGQGVHAFPIDEKDGTKLVGDVIAQLKLGHPVTATEPYSAKWTHVVEFFKYDSLAQTLTVMDPLGGHAVTRAVHEWAQLLLFHEVWGMEKIAVLSLPDALAKAGWTLSDALYSPDRATPHIAITNPFKDYILTRAAPWHPSDYAETPAYHLAMLEGSNPALGGGMQQVFRFSMLCQKDGHTDVIEESVGQELNYLRGKFAEALAKNAAAVNQIQADQTLIVGLQQQLAQVQLVKTA